MLIYLWIGSENLEMIYDVLQTCHTLCFIQISGVYLYTNCSFHIYSTLCITIILYYNMIISSFKMIIHGEVYSFIFNSVMMVLSHGLAGISTYNMYIRILLKVCVCVCFHTFSIQIPFEINMTTNTVDSA